MIAPDNMNILAINWRCIKNPEMGGAEIHFHEIFKRIAAKGHNVTLVAHKFTGAPEEETVDGIKIIRIGNKFLFDKQFKSYYKTITTKYDLVVDDISKIPLFTPTYVREPVVGILHHIHGNSLYKEIPAPLAFYIIKKEKQIPKYYGNTPIFTVSESTRRELIELGQPENMTDILYNAINHELFNKIEIRKSETPLIAYVGRIKKYKNLETIVDAVEILKNKIPELEFVIAGTGDNEEQLKAYVKNKGLASNIKFLGYVSEEEKAELLSKAWLFVTMPMKEGWGITVLEANAMGTPAIGSDVAGLRDSIRNNEIGLLTPYGKPDKLAEKISMLIKNKSELQRLSENAKKWADKFTWDASAEHFLKKIIEWFPYLKQKIIQ